MKINGKKKGRSRDELPGTLVSGDKAYTQTSGETALKRCGWRERGAPMTSLRAAPNAGNPRGRVE